MNRIVVARDRTLRSPKVDAARRRSGFGLLETVASLAVASLAAMAALYATRAVTSAIRLDAARSTLLLVLLDARRIAYVADTTVDLRLPVGATEVVLDVPTRSPIRTALPLGTYVIASNRREGVRFRPSGLADNATFLLGDPTTDHRAKVVVNQRGGIH